jgi:membrane-associated protease RseP (regulator of RpoE activity)
MSKIGGILIAIIILLAMVTIHEFGHYIAGKILGFKITEFSVGFGPALFKKRSKKTGETFSLRLIPLGGYCAFDGEDDSQDAYGGYYKKLKEKQEEKEESVEGEAPQEPILSTAESQEIEQLFSSIEKEESVESEPVAEHKVVYSDIDFNRHMNTMRYIDIVFDTMPIDVVENMNALRMDINFTKEARYGDSLKLMDKESESSRDYEFRNAEGDIICRMSLELR